MFRELAVSLALTEEALLITSVPIRGSVGSVSKYDSLRYMETEPTLKK
jgi:hypothetical protein